MSNIFYKINVNFNGWLANKRCSLIVLQQKGEGLLFREKKANSNIPFGTYVSWNDWLTQAKSCDLVSDLSR